MGGWEAIFKVMSTDSYATEYQPRARKVERDTNITVLPAARTVLESKQDL
jgi:hypothetical protein